MTWLRHRDGRDPRDADRPGVAAAIVGATSTAHLAAHQRIGELVLEAGDFGDRGGDVGLALARRATCTRWSATANGPHGRIMKYGSTSELASDEGRDARDRRSARRWRGARLRERDGDRGGLRAVLRRSRSRPTSACRRQSPLATAQGDRRGDERREDLSDAGSRRRRARAQRELEAVAAYPEGSLAPRERLQRRVFAGEQQLLLERHRWRNHLYPLNQIVGPQVDVPRVLASQPLTDVASARRWLRRLSAAGPHLEGLVQRLERRLPPASTCRARSTRC